MLIWGNKGYSDQLGFVVNKCPSCGQTGPFAVHQVRKKFTIYFIPTFSYSNKQYLECRACQASFEVPSDKKEEIAESIMSQKELSQLVAKLSAARSEAEIDDTTDDTKERESGGETINAHEVALFLIPTKEKAERYWQLFQEYVPEESREDVWAEFYLLLVYIHEISILIGLECQERLWVQEEYMRYWVENSPVILDDIQARRDLYSDAMNNPHPEFGIGYSIAKKYAETTNVHDVAALATIVKIFEDICSNTKDLLNGYKITKSEG